MRWVYLAWMLLAVELLSLNLSQGTIQSQGASRRSACPLAIKRLAMLELFLVNDDAAAFDLGARVGIQGGVPTHLVIVYHHIIRLVLRAPGVPDPDAEAISLEAVIWADTGIDDAHQESIAAGSVELARALEHSLGSGHHQPIVAAAVEIQLARPLVDGPPNPRHGWDDQHTLARW